MIPAAADEVSALQASLFTAYGTLYQQVSAEAAAIHDMFVNTLGTSAAMYAAAEAANSAAAASPLSVGDVANLVNIGFGNWDSAASDLLGLANGGLLPPCAEGRIAADAAAGAERPESEALEPTAAAAGGLGVAPVATGVGGASPIGASGTPPSWVGMATPVASTGAGALRGAGWSVAAPQAGPGTIAPGMPGLASAARNSAGFGAPRYGVKPIVVPKPVSG